MNQPGSLKLENVYRQGHPRMGWAHNLLKWMIPGLVTGLTALILAGIFLYSPRIISSSQSLPTLELQTNQAAATAERGVLRIQNQTPFLVILYAGGVRIGWLRPQRIGLIRNLSNGYHRLFAHTQYASTSWGPRDIWVPGTWNLVY